MQAAIDLTIQVFIVSTMLALGLKVPAARIARGVRDRRTMTAGLFVNLVAIPALGLLTASVLDLGGEIRAGYLLIAFSPGAPYAVKLIGIAGSQVASWIGLIIALQLAGVALVPVLAFLFIDSVAELQYPQLLATIILLQLVPLIIGLIGQGRKWMGSPGTTRTIVTLSNSSFAVLVALILIHDLPRVVQVLGPRIIAAVVGLIVVSLTTGAFLTGREPSERRALGLISAARKGGLALVIATSTFGGDNDTVIMIVAYALIELILLTTVAAWWGASRRPVTPGLRPSSG